PPDGGDDRQDQAGPDGEHADHGPRLLGEALADQQDGQERARHDERDDPDGGEHRVGHGGAAQPLIRSTSSTSMLLRFRYSMRTRARPTPTSAAATAITTRANTWPVACPSWVPKATRLMF